MFGGWTPPEEKPLLRVKGGKTEKAAEAGVREAFRLYIAWQGMWDGKDGGDESTFLAYVGDVLNCDAPKVVRGHGLLTMGG